MGLFGTLLYLAVWIAEVSQFTAVVGMAILGTAVIMWACIGSERFRLRDAIRLATGVAIVLVLLAAIGLLVLSSRVAPVG